MNQKVIVISILTRILSTFLLCQASSPQLLGSLTHPLWFKSASKIIPAPRAAPPPLNVCLTKTFVELSQYRPRPMSSHPPRPWLTHRMNQKNHITTTHTPHTLLPHLPNTPLPCLTSPHPTHLATLCFVPKSTGAVFSLHMSQARQPWHRR